MAIKPRNLLKLINILQADCAAHDMELVLHNETSVSMDVGINVAGYFSEDERKLHVAGLANDWVLTMVHEYCHFEQWKESKFIGPKYETAYVLFDEWITGNKKLKKEQKLRYTKLIQECELDCEKRALKYIIKYDVCSPEEYIQKSNAYVWGIAAARESSAWFKDGQAPSRLPELWKTLPKTFVKNLEPPKDILNKMKDRCF